VTMRRLTILALAVALGLAAAGSPFASSSPDGLSKVAADKGFLGDGRTAAVQERAPAPGYAFPGIGDPRLAKGLVGFTGTLLVFAAGAGTMRLVRGRPA